MGINKRKNLEKHRRKKVSTQGINASFRTPPSRRTSRQDLPPTTKVELEKSLNSLRDSFESLAFPPSVTVVVPQLEIIQGATTIEQSVFDNLVEDLIKDLPAEVQGASDAITQEDSLIQLLTFADDFRTGQGSKGAKIVGTLGRKIGRNTKSKAIINAYKSGNDAQKIQTVSELGMKDTISSDGISKLKQGIQKALQKRLPNIPKSPVSSAKHDAAIKHQLKITTVPTLATGATFTVDGVKNAVDDLKTLENELTSQEGTFRLQASEKNVKGYIAGTLDKSEMTVNIVIGSIKKQTTEEGLIPKDLAKTIVDNWSNDTNIENFLNDFTAALKSLPTKRQDTITDLLGLMKKVTNNAETTKMTESNMGLVGWSILFSKEPISPNPLNITAEMKTKSDILTAVLENLPYLSSKMSA